MQQLLGSPASLTASGLTIDFHRLNMASAVRSTANKEIGAGEVGRRVGAGWRRRAGCARAELLQHQLLQS